MIPYRLEKLIHLISWSQLNKTRIERIKKADRRNITPKSAYFLFSAFSCF